MKKILIASYDLEVGGVERSLISMLDNFDYKNYKVDLMLYRHQGDFMPLLSDKVNLLEEVPEYASFRKSIGTLLKEMQLPITFSRIAAKLHADIIAKLKSISEPGYYQMQLMWKYALHRLPPIKNEYDVAISYLWPHDFVAEKVMAKRKIAWIHTDYSSIETDRNLDLHTWSKFDTIMAVSEGCKEAFLVKYPEFKSKIKVMENIVSQDFIKNMAYEEVHNPLTTDGRFKVVTVARLSHAKGIDIAVETLKRLKDIGYSNIAWYVVGYGGDEQMIKDLITKHHLKEDFILLGKKTNPYPYMKAADLYVQPSRYEGKAVTVTEAQVLGKAVLITNYTTAESQIKNGENGLICEMNIKDLASGIERLYLDQEELKKISEFNESFNHSNRNDLKVLYESIDKQKIETLPTTFTGVV